MRPILLLCLLLLVSNCEDSQSKKKKSTSEPQTSVKKEPRIIKKDTVDTSEKEFIKLTDKNVMDFFMDYDKRNKENKVRLYTDYGNIDILLFDETKFHRSNFIFLTKQHYFDNTQFHRVVKNFIIQGGNTDDPEVAKRRSDIGRYLLPNDTKKGFKHDRGVISMPSSDIDNPHKLASPYEFFIVTQKGGAHHLDGNYTIFGKVISGMDVVDSICNQPTDGREWPLENIFINKTEIIE
ncbi:peptidylprolyl isomerase [Mangrovimonas aestuarii]|uniref:peptidylprolyl isomerase n=1 Tax=Mangrovimonas aestuarii TaxID=3018443 RepID=UPI002378784D|nr:peptidylprolyl isomerase [Mangrovimonas aestuarii]